MARPKKRVDKKTFEGLCAIQCTKAEICAALDVTDKTLEKWCKRTYQDGDGNPLGFSDVFAIKRGRGKISLRRAQFKLAEKSANMAIWLGKQYLGQSDSVVYNFNPEQKEDDPLTKALKEEAEELNHADQ